MLAIVEGILANLRCAPAVDGDVEVSTGINGRDEASHRWHAKCAPILDELGVRNDMAVDLEFLQRHTSITARRKEEDVPIVVTHGGNGQLRDRY